MKLIFITNNFPPVVDGVGDYTYHLSHQFAETGHQVYIICSKKKEIINYWEKKAAGIHIIPLVNKWNFQGVNTILKQVKKINPDWISFQYVPYSFNHYGIPLSIAYLFLRLRLKNDKTAVTFHEIAVRLDINKPKYIPIAIMQRAIAFCISLASNKIITSIDLYKNMLSYCAGKIWKIPVGSNIIPVALDGATINLLKRVIAPANEFVLCSFGSNLRKNDLLVDIVAELTRDLHNIKLIFLGKLPALVVDDIKKKAVRLNVSDKIIIPGYLKPEDVFLYLKCSNLFLQIEEITGKNQGGVSTKSGAIAAAYAAGLPIIGTRGDMTDDFFRNHENIIFVGSDDKQEIKNSIICFLQDNHLLSEIKQHALKSYKDHLEWPVIAGTYEKALHEMK